MLSGNKWQALVPREPKANLGYRQKLLRIASRGPAEQAALRWACSEDILLYINAFIWQYNPRKKGGREVGPFLTWPFQEEAIAAILRGIEEDDDLLIEKSREMGASWLCLIVMEWLWHFRPWQKFLCISRSETAVEDDDPDSLFWKIDFIHRYLPDWLLPSIDGRTAIKRRKLYFGNEQNHSTITGQASTGRAGVGGRATAMFIDEFSQIKEDYEVLHRTSDTTGCRIFNGTHRGTGTAFHELSERVDMRKVQMHWTQHPDKCRGLYRYDEQAGQVEVLDKSFAFPPEFDFIMAQTPTGGPHPGLRSPWYDRECGRKGSPRAIAMDLDIDAGGSVSQFFNPITIRELRKAYALQPLWEGDISYDRESGRPLGLVPLPGGPLKLWCLLKPDGSLPRSQYGAGADLATGSGATNSCLSIVDGHTGEKVLEYTTPHVLPELFAPIATACCWLFKDEEGQPTMFGWEQAGPGMIFGARVIELGYGRIYYREGGTSTLAHKTALVPGWYPSNKEKRVLLEEYRAALDQRQFVNRCDLALEECLHYRYGQGDAIEHSQEIKTQDPTGARTNHGDRVIADALAWKMVRGIGRKYHRKQEESIVVGSLAWRRQLADDKARRERAWA